MSSFWLETNSQNLDFPALNSDIVVDTCIIGAGLFGLNTGYYLSNSGIKVAILERENNIGTKTSGNSTAKLTSQHSLFYSHLIKDYGIDFGKKYLNANEEAISNIKKIIDIHNIDCDFEWQDSFVYTTNVDEDIKIQDEVDAVNILGLNAEFVTKTSLPFEISSAIKFPNQAQFHVSKFMNGLASCILNNNGKIFVDSGVENIAKDADGYNVFTSNNKVHCKNIVMASHYPFLNIPGFYFSKMYQSTSYAIAVDTHTDLFDGMYISSPEPIFSFRTALYNGKKILIVGGNNHKTGEAIENNFNYSSLENKIFGLYPSSEILFRWNTEDCISLDKIPYIGKYSNIMPNIYIGTGFKKWGMSTSNVAANIVTDMILGRKNEYSEVFSSTRLRPIKNRWEMKNMVKQTANSLVFNKYKIPSNSISNIGLGNAEIISIKGQNVGVYKSPTGEVFAVKPNCSHLGCLLAWNNLDKTWDCPCHGSRFDYKGNNLYSPANKGLDTIEINNLE